ncbi:OB-fold domain-containing protein [Mycobacterium sp. 050128]|uniref:Zn-ribbon domain-containing OB-fold protein n=1 Tax=Mycobacterium TaxID=1763 RepID=UPI0005B4D701|nr:OB-fold domain-containing protein [Mycobacterium intracellulare]ARV80160.1 DNA-binding protein [Mycobacterium intracellulare subsp. chimaera]KPN47660.1 DNA-binding protein [Mycobacterium intracellulare subsp. chimaera]KPN48972.1 DNA-binding protein [Mycobacterium intracellulare subsp. chimaera]MDM3909159.1 OB-fold domain-containing protein [Mycobacterium intracellulare subsp. chimaera]QGK46733.1 DNA-binding protein [Mycobacterium intracellulare subsp. chimaera]
MSRIDVTAPPTPSLDGLSGQFYDHCRRHQLSFQRCSRCHRWRHIPRLTCAECGSDAWSWHISSGRGVVYSSTVIHRALHPGLEDATPFVCAIVEMDEGVRVAARVVDMAPGTALQAGAAVEVTYIDVTDDVVLPAFRLFSPTENDDD